MPRPRNQLIPGAFLFRQRWYNWVHHREEVCSMRKLVCVLTALLLILCGTALAESVIYEAVTGKIEV